MLGVMFGNTHSFYDLGLLLKSYPQISPPVPKTKFVDVPGRNGRLNLSRTLTGFMQHDRRTIQMEFTILGPREDWLEIHSGIMDALHGQEMDVILDDDPEFCYTGEIAVKEFDPGKATSIVTITADVEPYKTRIDATRMSITVSGSQTATIDGGKKPVIPAITASSAMQMTFAGQVYDLKDGENTFPDVIIREGVNTFTFTGDGTVVLEYREGRF